MERAVRGYGRGVTERAEVGRPGDEPRSLTERRDAVVEEAFAASVDGLKAAYDAYGAHIHRFCARTLGPDRANDATQEVFVAAWRARERFDPTRGPLVGWLTGIARNKVKGALRDTGRHPVPAAGTADLAAAPGAASTAAFASTHDEVDALADRLVVARSLRALPERAASVVRLAYLEGLSHQEVADRLAMPLGTVKSDIRRGLERLRRDLGGIDG
jgi:RNA polymerase sigma-70 factor (ECF subfamily)